MASPVSQTNQNVEKENFEEEESVEEDADDGDGEEYYEYDSSWDSDEEVVVNPVAKIPWIPLKTSDVKLEDDKFFQKVMTAGKEGERRIDLYRLLTQTFPFYLPQRYHTMDCKSLHENSKNGQYWANASHFVYCNFTHGYLFFRRFMGNYKLENPNLARFTTTGLNSDLLDSLLMDGPEQCKSAAEFLLEPWVLIQLPLQPVLLHQWAVALLAESLKFHKEISDFVCIAFPSHLMALVKKLYKMHSTMCIAAREFFLFFNVHILNIHGNHQNSANKCCMRIVRWFPKVLPVIEFVLSEECRNIVRALKRMSWNSSTKVDHGNKKTDGLYDFMGCRKLYFYVPEFWKQEEKITSFLPTEKDFPFIDNEKMVTVKVKKATELERNELKQFVKEKLITSGRIKGGLLQELCNDDELLLACHVQYLEYKETSNEAEGIQEQDSGFITNIYNLYSDLAQHVFVMNMASIIVNRGNKICNLSHGHPMYLYVDAVDCEGPETTLAKIKRAISNVEVSDKWSLKSLLKSVKATCFSPDRTLGPDFSQGAAKVAEHFEERIRNLVFKMIEKQLQTLKGSFRFYPECQFVQFILPCFVATLLDLDKDPSVSQETKQDYMNFIHELLKSYEKCEYSCDVSKDLLHPYFTRLTQGQIVMESKIVGWQTSVEIYLCELLEGSNAFEVLRKKGLNFLTMFDSIGFQEVGHLDSFWHQLPFMFLCRMAHCIEKLGHAKKRLVGMQTFHWICSMSNGPIMSKHGRESLQNLTLLLAVNMNKDCRKGIQIDQASKVLTHILIENKCAVPAELFEAAKNLLGVQLFGLAMFSFFDIFESEDVRSLLNKVSSGPGFPLDSTDVIYWALYSKDLWKAKQEFSKMVKYGESGDPSLVTLTFARSNLLYVDVLKKLTPEGKVKMTQPGEITFFPVIHCRWCGLVQEEDFRMCPECRENPDYPDVNYFCSEECEKESLDKQHIEEHARYLMIKCEIAN